MDELKISTLKELPSLSKESLNLIESAFGYSSNNSFAIDFYPLVCQANFENCYVLLDRENKILAHLAALPVKVRIKNIDFSWTFYGGIAVAPGEEGKGHFKKLFNYVLEQYQKSSLHFLWSDKLELYSKFEFYPTIDQFQYTKQDIKFNSDFIESSLNKISQDEFNQIKQLYNRNNEIRVLRENEHWEKLKKITSTRLFIKKDQNKITNYFFMSKGEDLTDIIHEYGHISDSELRDMLTIGTVWTPFQNDEFENENLYGSLLKIGDSYEFSQFINIYTQNKITIEKVKDDLVHFQFMDSTYTMSASEFLQGIFGPNRYEELSSLSPIFICGLDSI